MLTRRDNSGYLYRCDSKDGGKTWDNLRKTEIPNPSNKSLLVNLDDGRIALFNVPNSIKYRFPLELWISDDDMKTWKEKIRLTDFPGQYSYSDAFYENGHLHMVIEHNRHSILYFDITL